MKMKKKVLENRRIFVFVCVILLGCLVAICHYHVNNNDDSLQDSQNGEITVKVEGDEKEDLSLEQDNRISIELVNVSKIEDQFYTGKAIEPELTLSYNDKILMKDNDYTLSFFNNTKVGVGEIIVTGKGEYKGSLSIDFNIIEQKKVDHKQDNKNTEVSKKISVEKAELSLIEDQIYTGKAITPHIELVYNDKTLKRDVDFTVSYSDNIDIGTAKIVMKGIGQYDGELTTSFKIIEKKSEESKTIELNILTSHHGFKGYYTKDDNILNVDKSKLGLNENDSISLYFIEYYDAKTGESILFACPYVQEVVFMEQVDKAGGWDSVAVNVKQ